jgi:hypothetical protein
MKELGLGKLTFLWPKASIQGLQCENMGDIIYVHAKWLGCMSGSATASPVSGLKVFVRRWLLEGLLGSGFHHAAGLRRGTARRADGHHERPAKVGCGLVQPAGHHL